MRARLRKKLHRQLSSAFRLALSGAVGRTAMQRKVLGSTTAIMAAVQETPFAWALHAKIAQARAHRFPKVLQAHWYRLVRGLGIRTWGISGASGGHNPMGLRFPRADLVSLEHTVIVVARATRTSYLRGLNVLTRWTSLDPSLKPAVLVDVAVAGFALGMVAAPLETVCGHPFQDRILVRAGDEVKLTVRSLFPLPVQATFLAFLEPIDEQPFDTAVLTGSTFGSA